ncbi:MAG: hypothetical protein RBR34_10395 [Rhodospirillaceae bacterium]|jgi:hypothetical protein|nr:hypothetical protein [Rhodospirillaceae bacterium]
MSIILGASDGPSRMVTHVPHVLPEMEEGEEYEPVQLQAIIVSHGRQDDAAVNKVFAHAYFSREDLASPQYQDTLTAEDGTVWKLIRDAGSNDDLMRWEVERDIRSIMGRQRV